MELKGNAVVWLSPHHIQTHGTVGAALEAAASGGLAIGMLTYAREGVDLGGGWVRIGEAEITARLSPPDTSREVEALRAELADTRGYAARETARIEAAIARLSGAAS